MSVDQYRTIHYESFQYRPLGCPRGIWRAYTIYADALVGDGTGGVARVHIQTSHREVAQKVITLEVDAWWHFNSAAHWSKIYYYLRDGSIAISDVISRPFNAGDSWPLEGSQTNIGRRRILSHALPRPYDMDDLVDLIVHEGTPQDANLRMHGGSWGYWWDRGDDVNPVFWVAS